MKTFALAGFLLALARLPFTSAQDSSANCATACIANTTNTNCQVGEWPCLCASQVYLNQLNPCVVKSCNATNDQLAAFAAIDEICAIFSVTLSITPEATLSRSGIVSGVPLPTGNPLPNVTLSAISTSAGGTSIILSGFTNITSATATATSSSTPFSGSTVTSTATTLATSLSSTGAGQSASGGSASASSTATAPASTAMASILESSLWGVLSAGLAFAFLHHLF